MREELEREYVEYIRARLPELRRPGHLLCRDADRADDVVQAAITTVYVGWPRVRAADNVDAYVRKVVVRTFLSEQRRPWARVRLTGALPDRPADPGQPAEERLAVRAALRRLPSRQRAILVLRFLCDLSVADVAATLGCATGTVKSQTSDGLAALRKALAAASPPIEQRSRK
jgi:RNA polymerase sigma-70 factor (sigma-E family)